MKKELAVFNRGNWSVRTVEKDSKVWFIGKDIAESLGYKDTKKALKSHCKYAELFKGGVSPPLNFPPRGMTIIPESDMYRLIMRSKLPEAQAFEEWVMEEVIPAIGKTGMYGEFEDMIPKDYSSALRLAADKQEQIEQLQLVQAEDKPYTDFGKSVNDTTDTVSIREFAQTYGRKGLGQNNLFKLLRDKKVLRKNLENQNVPFQSYLDREYFFVKTNCFNEVKDDKANDHITYQCRLTGKGQMWLNKMIPKWLDNK